MTHNLALDWSVHRRLKLAWTELMLGLKQSTRSAMEKSSSLTIFLFRISRFQSPAEELTNGHNGVVPSLISQAFFTLFKAALLEQWFFATCIIYICLNRDNNSLSLKVSLSVKSCANTELHYIHTIINMSLKNARPVLYYYFSRCFFFNRGIFSKPTSWPQDSCIVL